MQYIFIRKGSIKQMSVSGSLVCMWIGYAFMGIFPLVYVTIKGGKKK